MLASKADLERKIAYPGRTALHVAAEYHRPEATAILLEHGALVDALDNNRQTVLHIVAKGPGIQDGLLLSSKPRERC
jgi:ankyrin repeat protein